MSEREPYPEVSYADVERLMWHFFTPTTLKQTVENYVPPPPPSGVPGGAQVPRSAPPPCMVGFPVRWPAWQRANFWSHNAPQADQSCISWYESWTTVFNYVVPADRVLLVDEISIGFPIAREQFEINEVQVLRNQEEIARWEECITVVATPSAPKNNEATSVAFGGHLSPIPFYGRFAQNDRFIVRVRARGREPFNKVPSEVYGGQARVLPGGWLASIMDGRDDAPRPVDTAQQRDIYGHIIPTATQRQIMKNMDQWLTDLAEDPNRERLVENGG